MYRLNQQISTCVEFKQTNYNFMVHRTNVSRDVVQQGKREVIIVNTKAYYRA